MHIHIIVIITYNHNLQCIYYILAKRIFNNKIAIYHTIVSISISHLYRITPIQKLNLTF